MTFKGSLQEIIWESIKRLVAIVDKEDLTIQVHSNDEYAKFHESGALEKQSAGIL